MKFVEKLLNKLEEPFQKGRFLSRFYPLFEAMDTFLLSPSRKAQRAPFVRDSVDLKRVMSLVIVALLPCIFMGIYNTGYQILSASGKDIQFFRAMFMGAFKVLPIILVSYTVGALIEAFFAVVRKHEINEGFLVTGILFPLSLPPSIPLWQVAIGIAFGVIIGKEVFGGTGMNVLNPALTGRIFLFFSYPAYMSGDAPWTAVDGFSRATPLSVLASCGSGADPVLALRDAGYGLKDLFFGFIPGSIGETSALACLIGALFLIIVGVGSWRIMLSSLIGMIVMSSFLLICGHSNPMLNIPPHIHLLVGSYLFGTIFMATDPVSAAATNIGRWIYGFFIGVLIVLIRAVNLAYPEGVMLAILFMNVFAPLIDHYVVRANIVWRKKRASTL